VGILRAVMVLLATLLSAPVSASFHTFQLNEFYSNADGSIQYVELKESFGANGQQFLAGRTISSAQGGTTHTFVFPADLPSAITANTSVLIATPGFAALGIVTPDYIVPAGFLFIGGGTVDYAGVDSVAFAALPTGGHDGRQFAAQFRRADGIDPRSAAAAGLHISIRGPVV